MGTTSEVMKEKKECCFCHEMKRVSATYGVCAECASKLLEDFARQGVDVLHHSFMLSYANRVLTVRVAGGRKDFDAGTNAELADVLAKHFSKQQQLIESGKYAELLTKQEELAALRNARQEKETMLASVDEVLERGRREIQRLEALAEKARLDVEKTKADLSSSEDTIRAARAEVSQIEGLEATKRDELARLQMESGIA